MNAYPFSVFKRADRACYSVSFKDQNGKYLAPVSTGKKTEAEAVQAAFLMLRDGMQQDETAVTVHDLSLRDMVRRIKTKSEAEIILSELKRLGWINSFVFCDTPGSVDFISFLKTFWDWETSPYIKEKLRKKHGIHKSHCKKQGQAITLYWEKFFEGRFLGTITADDIDAFITYMGDMELSAARKNTVIKAGFKALRWAFAKNKIQIDPTRGHIMYTEEEQKRNILNPTVAAAVFRTVWKDDRAKVANMLASVTGMRSGEIRALQFQDLGSDCIFVRSSWNGDDKLKPTKNNQPRKVEIPFPVLMKVLIELAKQNPWGVKPDSFIFWAETKKNIPISERFFVSGLRDALIQIGYTKEQAADYDFHGWRHFFTSYMVKKLDRKLLKSQTGHLTDDMIELYSDHETEGDRETIHNVSKETFAGLLPDKPNVIAFKKKSLNRWGVQTNITKSI
jgi:integrase